MQTVLPQRVLQLIESPPQRILQLVQQHYYCCKMLVIHTFQALKLKRSYRVSSSRLTAFESLGQLPPYNVQSGLTVSSTLTPSKQLPAGCASHTVSFLPLFGRIIWLSVEPSPQLLWEQLLTAAGHPS